MITTPDPPPLITPIAQSLGSVLKLSKQSLAGDAVAMFVVVVGAMVDIMAVVKMLIIIILNLGWRYQHI